MKLVLLPGLHGTQQLFQPFVEQLGVVVDTQVISYPVDMKMDYQQLQEHIEAQLPDQDFILLGESFSGPLVYQIALNYPVHLKAVIFVASFLNNPRPRLLNPVSIGLAQLLLRLPIPALTIKTWLTGPVVNDQIVVMCKRVLVTLPPDLLAFRLTEISKISGERPICTIPALYIRALHDKLVPGSCLDSLRKVFTNLEIINQDSGHFVLQTQPKACAKIIIDFVDRLSDKTKGVDQR